MLKTLKDDFGIAKPRIAVLGVNPHAGEGGMLGNEEQQIIKPAIIEIKKKGDLVFGPFPADGFFGTQTYRKYDAVLAMYHDQGLVPFKALAFDRGINYTAGLPIVRTSPDHGTAYDIAGKGIADPTSMREAIFAACDIVKVRREKSTRWIQKWRQRRKRAYGIFPRIIQKRRQQRLHHYSCHFCYPAWYGKRHV